MGEEEEKFTTPFDEVIDWIMTLIWYLKEYGKVVKEDVDWEYFVKDGELSEETIRKSFIDSATIPDGWNMIKEIREVVLNQMAHQDDDLQLRVVLEEINDRLKMAGIEVKDEE